MSGLPGSPTTDGNGYYSAMVDYGWDGTVTPSHDYYTFEPSQRVYSNVVGNQSNQNYTPESAIADANLIGWWSFDNDTADDVSGYGHDGTIVGNVSIVTDSKRGKVLSCPGGAGNYVNCGGGGAENWADGMEQITIAAWVKIDQYTTVYQYIAAKEGAWRVMRYSDTTYPRFYTNGSPTSLLGTTDIQGGDWHHFAGVSDGTTKYIYIDGVLENSVTRQLPIDDSDPNIIIAGTERADSLGRTWCGYIDDVRLYDKALSGTEVYELYASSYEASNPYPADGAENVPVNADLSWSAGYLAADVNGHDVYFGTNFADVNAGISAVHMGLQSSTSFDPGQLEAGVTYYWAVDEVNDLYIDSPWIGKVWSFTTVDANLVGWWKFEDDDSDGVTTDSSGYGHNGTLINDANISYDAERGNVLNLDHATNCYVDCGGGPSDGDWAAFTDNMTAMAWVKIDNFTTSYQYILSKGDTYRISRYSDSDYLRFFNTGFVPSSLVGSINIADGEWHHIAATYDGAQRLLYIDGQVDAYDSETGNMGYNSDNFIIGGHETWPARAWQGLIDDVRLYDKALSQTQIQVRAGLTYATNPTPENGSRDVLLDANLSWSPGAAAATTGGHSLYFGTSYTDVYNRDQSVHIGYLDSPSYDPGTLSSTTTYYWVVDTNNANFEDSPWYGDIWSFKTIDPNLIGYWNFDDDTADDKSGNGRDGSLVGNAQIVNKALQLDGSGDYVQITGYKGILGTNSRTTAAWVKAVDNGNSQMVVSWGNPSAGEQWIFRVDDTGLLRQGVSSGNVIGTTQLFDGKWHHVVSVIEDDGSPDADEIKLYIDGIEESSYSNVDPQAMNTASNYDVCIGSWQSGVYFNGMIDEVRIYDKALSAAEVWNIYNSEIAQNPSPEDTDFNVSLTPTLSWTPGQNVASYGQELYIGTDYSLVASRDNSVYVGALDVNSYSPSLKLYRQYYWAVDIVDAANNVWYGNIWTFRTRHVQTQTEGYYRDYFMDGGAGIAAYESLPATNLLGLNGEFVKDPTIDGYNGAYYLMTDIHLGDWDDDNGLLLYPDGDARFRVMYVGGGSSLTHGDSLLAPEAGMVDAQDRVRQFYAKGGGYIGNCAGAAMQFFKLGTRGATYFRLFANFKGSFTNIASSSTDYEIPDGITERRGAILPKSPLLKYYDFGGDYYINSVRQNGGNWCKWWDPSMNWPASAQVCAVYNDKIDGEVVREGYKTTDGASVWAYKDDDESGRLCPCGGHPEGVSSGEKRELEAAMFAYALDGGGCPVVKAALSDGVTRQMNDNTTTGYEKIGDKQYHHFTIDVPQGASQLQISLDGSMYDMNLFAKHEDFAFYGEPDIVSATNGSGCDETVTIQSPAAGTWYIGVKCVTVPTRTDMGGYWKYTGNLEVCNGLAYDITATVTE